MNYTQQQFNEMAARAEGYEVKNHRIHKHNHFFGIADYYADLNELIPLVFKYEIEIIKIREDEEAALKYLVDAQKLDVEAINEDPIQAIRDCLWQIWSEGNTNE